MTLVGGKWWVGEGASNKVKDKVKKTTQTNKQTKTLVLFSIVC